MKYKILIVDDEVHICELLRLELTLEGYECETAYNGSDAIKKFESFFPDLVVLDLMLPEINGLEVCSRIRAMRDVAVIMLTAKVDIDEKILGLKTGADDYITKPFDTNELLARIEALLRRYSTTSVAQPATLKNGTLRLIPESQAAFIGEDALHLTATEFDILKLFVSNKNRAFTREMIANELGIDFAADTRAIDMHIQRLRRKISAFTEERFIETVFGIGYKMRDLDAK